MMIIIIRPKRLHQRHAARHAAGQRLQHQGHAALLSAPPDSTATVSGDWCLAHYCREQSRPESDEFAGRPEIDEARPENDALPL